MFGFETETCFIGEHFSPVWPAHYNTEHWWSTDLPRLLVSVPAHVRVWDRDTLCWRTFPPSLTAWNIDGLQTYHIYKFLYELLFGFETQTRFIGERSSPVWPAHYNMLTEHWCSYFYRLTTSISFCTSSCSGFRQRHALLANVSPQFDRPITTCWRNTDVLQTYHVYQFLYQLLFGFETETRFVGERFSPVWPAHDNVEHWCSTDLPHL